MFNISRASLVETPGRGFRTGSEWHFLGGLAGLFINILAFRVDQIFRSQKPLVEMARNNRIKLKPPDVCPVCGEDVPSAALACPECGADHNSGWRQDADTYDGLDLPEEDFDHDEFVRQEFGSSLKPAGLKTIWWVTGILVIIASVALYFLAAR